MTIEYKNYLAKLNATGKKIISLDIKSDNAWDDLYILVSQLEIDCKKFRVDITKRRDKDEKKPN